MFSDLKKSPKPSKSEGKKGQPGGNAPTGVVPPTKVPGSKKKPPGTSTSRPNSGSSFNPHKE